MPKRIRIRTETPWPRKAHRSVNPVLRRVQPLLPADLDDQIELARTSGVGHSTVRNWLKGTRNPTFGTLEALVNALGYDLAMVPKGSNNDRPNEGSR